MIKSLKVTFLTLLFISAIAIDHEGLELNKMYVKEINKQAKFVFNISEDKVKQLNSTKWFFFVEIEPSDEQPWRKSIVEMSVGQLNSQNSKNVKSCNTFRSGGLDSCYLANNQFNYKTQEVHIKVMCMNICSIKISGQISKALTIKPNQQYRMDFQNTAYSQVFELDTTNEQPFDQLRIYLTKQSIDFSIIPFHIYVNKNTKIPTRQHHDYKSISMWGDGEGVFISGEQSKGVFTILVEGPENVILQLNVVLFNKTQSYKMKQYLPFFDYLVQNEIKTYNIEFETGKDIYLTAITISGSISILGLFDSKDTQIKNEFVPLNHEYGHLVYFISAEIIENILKKYSLTDYIKIKVKGIKQSAFLLNYYLPKRHQLIQLRRNTVVYSEIKQKTYHQYLIFQAVPNKTQVKRINFDLNFQFQQNFQLKIRFFICSKRQKISCQLSKNQIQKNSISKTKMTQYTSYQLQSYKDDKKKYKFSFPIQNLKTHVYEKYNITDKQLNLIILIQNQLASQHAYTLQYIPFGMKRQLIQKQINFNYAYQNEEDYFSYTNYHDNIDTFFVHLYIMAGNAYMVGYTEDPRINKNVQEIHQLYKRIKFTNIQVNQTIYIKVVARQFTDYGIQVNPWRKQQINWHNRTKDNNSKGYNQIPLYQNMTHNFVLAPNQNAVYQIKTYITDLVIQINSNHPLELCFTQNIDKPPVHPNCDTLINLTKRATFNMTFQNSTTLKHIGNIGVLNKNELTTAFQIRYSPYMSNNSQQKNNQLENQCVSSSLGKIIRFSLKKNSKSCYSFYINTFQQLQFIDQLNYGTQIKSFSTKIQINNSQKTQITNQMHKFKKQVIEDACNKKTPCIAKVYFEAKNQTSISFTFQSLQGQISLVEGVALTFGHNVQKKNFIFTMYNKINTTIILQNKNGQYEFYANLIDANTFSKSSKKQWPSSKNYLVKSSNPFYYSYQIGQLRSQKIKQNQCKQCLLIITVEKINQDYNQKPGKFIIQVTQTVRYMWDNHPQIGFLSKRSMAFFEYQSKVNGSLLVSLDTQNKNCLTVKLKKGEDKSSGSSYDQIISQGGKVIQKVQIGYYSLFAQAEQDCYYTLTVSSSNSNSLKNIKRGYSNDLKMKRNQTIEYVYHHEDQNSFKILTLHQQGQVLIRVNYFTTIQQLYAKKHKTKSSNYQGVDFVKIFQVSNNTKAKSGFYKITIQALKNLTTTIMIPNRDDQFPLMMDSQIKDQLQQGQYQLYRIYSDSLSMYEMQLTYGQVQVAVMTSYNNTVLLNKTYPSQKNDRYQSLDLKPKPIQNKGDLLTHQYFKIKITAKKNSSFTFSIISDKDPIKRGIKAKYGQPQYINLEQNIKKCLVVTLHDKQQSFLISSSSSYNQQQSQILNKLQVSCTGDNKKILELSVDNAKNQKIVSIQDKNFKQGTYQFCLMSKSPIYLIFIHASHLNFLPQLKSVMITSQSNYTFYANGPTLMQINQCKSKAIVQISDNFGGITSMKSNIKQIRKVNGIIEFNYYGPVYVQVKTKSSASIAWRHRDQQKKMGLGYDQYYPQPVKYNMQRGLFFVYVFSPMNYSENSVTQFVGFDKYIYASQSESELFNAINCGNKEKTLVKKIDKTKNDPPYFTEEQLKQKFFEKSLIVGGLTIAYTNNNQTYRFISPYQYVPAAYIKGTKSIDSDGKIINDPQDNYQPDYTKPTDTRYPIVQTLAIIVIVAAVGLLVYHKIIKKIIKRRRKQRLSEQTAHASSELKYMEFSSNT